MDERKFVKENLRRILIKEKLVEEAKSAGFGGLLIQRTPLGTRIVLEVERPGLIIGRKGAKIKDLTDMLEKVYGVDNPQIEVKEAENVALNPQIMAEKLALALERGWHFRRAGHSTLRRIMEAGAKGAQIIISGKIVGDRARTEKFFAGKIKYCGKPAEYVRIGRTVAKTKPGVIGITIKILPPDVKLPDEINIVVKEEKEEEKVEEVSEESMEEEKEVNADAQGVESEGSTRDEHGGTAQQTEGTEE